MSLVSIKDAAGTLGVSVDTIRRRIKAGELEAHRDQTGKWFVALGEDTFTSLGAPAAEVVPTHGDVPPMQPQDAALPDLERLRLENSHFRELLDEVRDARDHAYADAAELRQLLAGSHMQLMQLQKALPTRPEEPAQAVATSEGSLPSHPWWAFWRLRRPEGRTSHRGASGPWRGA